MVGAYYVKRGALPRKMGMEIKGRRRRGRPKPNRRRLDIVRDDIRKQGQPGERKCTTEPSGSGHPRTLTRVNVGLI